MFNIHSHRLKLINYLLLSLMLMMCLSEQAAARSVEIEVKVAFVYNFVRFTTWPGHEESSDITLGYSGEDSFKAHVSVLDGRIFDKRTIRIEPVNADNLEKYEVLFLSSNDNIATKSILQKISGRPVLTVGGQPGFIEMGGIIELFLLNNKVRFRINNRRAIESGLRISSQVLSLAHEVIR